MSDFPPPGIDPSKTWFEMIGDTRVRVVPLEYEQRIDFDEKLGARIGTEVRSIREEPESDDCKRVVIRTDIRTTRPMKPDETFEMAAEDSQSFAHGGINDGYDQHVSWRPNKGSGATGKVSSYHKMFEDGSTWETYYKYPDG